MQICLSALQIDAPLLASSVMTPFVSYNNAKTPLLAPLTGYIGGTNENTLDALGLAGLVPALVSTLVGGIELRLGNFLHQILRTNLTATADSSQTRNGLWRRIPLQDRADIQMPSIQGSRMHLTLATFSTSGTALSSSRPY
jgi:hypothetical protein